MAEATAKAGKKGKKDDTERDFVSEDKDWRSAVENELRYAENWQKDWGFLANNSIKENPRTKEEQIQVLEIKV